MRVGIAAMGNRVGQGGGVSTYTRYLIESLADHPNSHTYYVILNEGHRDNWCYRRWPSHIHFVSLRSVEPQQPKIVRAWRLLRRGLGLSVPPHYGKDYLAQQIEALALDLLHFPCTVIPLLSVETPCVLTFFDIQHEYYPEFFTRQELDWRAKAYAPSVRKARRLIVPSEYTRQTLVEKYDVSNHKMTLIPVGLPPAFQHPDPSEITRVRDKYGLPDQFIFYPANPWQHKNHARLMAALRIYKEQHGEAPWLVLSGRLHNEHRDAGSLAIAAGVKDRVIDLEFVPRDDLPALYSAAYLMIFPSLFEGFGMPLIEAMGCGCPIAAANATAIPECVGDAALLFDPWDPIDIASKIHFLLTNLEARKNLIKRGYERSRKFDWKSATEQVVGVYEGALRTSQ